VKENATMRRREFGAAFAAVLAGIGLTSCGKSKKAERGDNDEVVVKFWHSMRGNNAEQLEGVVDDFNNSQKEVRVDATFQGMYDEAKTKVMQVIGTDDAPDVIQLDSNSKRELIDGGGIRPMHELVEADAFDTSVIQPAILKSREVEGKLYSMPQATSGALTFINRDILTKAGLDPDNPPDTFSDMRGACEKLVDSGLVKHGLAMLTDGGPFTDLMANQGELLYNNDNGRSGPPTEAVFNADAGVATMKWVDEMFKDGLLGNFGRSFDDLRPPWYAGDVAMILDTSAACIIHDKEAEFDVGAGSVPTADGVDPQGVSIGGADLYIFQDSPDEAQTAAFEFVKYMLKPAVQAKWAANTGYYPITADSYEEPDLKKQIEDIRSIKVANEQLEKNKLSDASLGIVAGVTPTEYVADAWEQMYDGTSPKEALDSAAKEVTEALGAYNDANG
jgi:sn-glycerol 3-phosphate transport system substrate-binding protein